MDFLYLLLKPAIKFWDLIVHFDAHINHWVQVLGPSVYSVVFLIIFCETGLIVAPFLPGDSLLFALGAIAASPGSSLSLAVLIPILMIGAIGGGFINYAIGSYLGPKVFTEESRWFKKEHVLKTRAFYEKYGARTIVIARFIPIIRTFAPFVAGVCKMNYARFALYNIVGGLFWVLSLVFLGHHFGNIPIVKKNLGLVVPLVIIISVLPLLFQFISSRKKKKQEATDEPYSNAR